MTNQAITIELTLTAYALVDEDSGVVQAIKNLPEGLSGFYLPASYEPVLKDHALRYHIDSRVRVAMAEPKPVHLQSIPCLDVNSNGGQDDSHDME